MKYNRRKFISLFSGIIGALWGGYLLWGIKEHYTFKEKQGFIKIKIPKNLENHKPYFIEKKKLFIIKNDNKIKVLSSICSHKGCILTIKAEGYICPCHEGKFTYEGELIGGKPEKGLTEYFVQNNNDGTISIDLSKQYILGITNG